MLVTGNSMSRDLVHYTHVMYGGASHALHLLLTSCILYLVAMSLSHLRRWAVVGGRCRVWGAVCSVVEFRLGCRLPISRLPALAACFLKSRRSHSPPPYRCPWGTPALLPDPVAEDDIGKTCMRGARNPRTGGVSQGKRRTMPTTHRSSLVIV